MISVLNSVKSNPCESADICPYFENLAASTKKVLQEQFCHTDKTKCARYNVRTTIGGDSVPEDLSPADLLRARQLIGSN